MTLRREAKSWSYVVRMLSAFLVFLEVWEFVSGASPSLSAAPQLPAVGNRDLPYTSMVDMDRMSYNPFLLQPQPTEYPEESQGHMMLQAPGTGPPPEWQQFGTPQIPISPSGLRPQIGSLSQLKGASSGLADRIQSPGKVPVQEIPRPQNSGSTQSRWQPAKSMSATVGNRAVHGMQDNLWEPASAKIVDTDPADLNVAPDSRSQIWRGQEAGISDSEKDYGLGSVQLESNALAREPPVSVTAHGMGFPLQEAVPLRQAEDPYCIGDVDAQLEMIERREQLRRRGRRPKQVQQRETTIDTGLQGDATVPESTYFGSAVSAPPEMPDLSEHSQTDSPFPVAGTDSVADVQLRTSEEGGVDGRHIPSMPPEWPSLRTYVGPVRYDPGGPVDWTQGRSLDRHTAQLNPQSPEARYTFHSPSDGLSLLGAEKTPQHHRSHKCTLSVSSPVSPESKPSPALQSLDRFQLDEPSQGPGSGTLTGAEETVKPDGTSKACNSPDPSDRTIVCHSGKRIDVAQEIRWFAIMNKADKLDVQQESLSINRVDDGDSAGSQYVFDSLEGLTDDEQQESDRTISHLHRQDSTMDHRTNATEAASKPKQGVLSLVRREQEDFDEVQRFKIGEMLKEMHRSAACMHETNSSAAYIDHAVYDSLVYNAMMYAVAGAANAGHASAEDGWAVHKRMQQAGVRPNLVTYHRMLQVVEGAARHGKASIPQMEQVVDMMKSDGLAPDRDCFFAMLEIVAAASLCGKAHLSDAYWVVQQLNNAGIQEDLSMLKTFLLVVIGDARIGLASHEETDKVMQRIKALGLAADYDTYAAAMQSLVCCAAWGKAAPVDGEHLLERMEAEEMPPSPAFYNAVLQIAAAASRHNLGGFADCQRLMERMNQKLESPPPLSTFSEMMRVCAEEAKHGRVSVQDGMNILRRMEEVHGAEVWTHLLPSANEGDDEDEEMMEEEEESSKEEDESEGPADGKPVTLRVQTSHRGSESQREVQTREKISKAPTRRSRSVEKLSASRMAAKQVGPRSEIHHSPESAK